MANLPMPDRDALAPAAREIYDRLVAKRGHIDGMYRVLLNHPALAGHVADLGTYFRFGSTVLPAAVRELVILWSARQCRAAYEWVKHEPVARAAGVADVVIEAVRRGERPAGLSPLDAAALDAATAVLTLTSLPAASQDVLLGEVGREGLIEVVALCGFYRLIAGVLFAFDVPLPEGSEPPF